MTTALADTNIFLRALINDHPHHKNAVTIFHKVRDKQLRLVVPSIILAEVVYVLKSPLYYNLQRAEIAALLMPFLRLPGLKLEESAVTIRALDIFSQTNLDIADAWLAAKAQLGKVSTICSFDQDFKKVPNITVLTP